MAEDISKVISDLSDSAEDIASHSDAIKESMETLQEETTSDNADEVHGHISQLIRVAQDFKNELLTAMDDIAEKEEG